VIGKPTATLISSKHIPVAFCLFHTQPCHMLPAFKLDAAKFGLCTSTTFLKLLLKAHLQPAPPRVPHKMVNWQCVKELVCNVDAGPCCRHSIKGRVPGYLQNTNQAGNSLVMTASSLKTLAGTLPTCGGRMWSNMTGQVRCSRCCPDTKHAVYGIPWTT